MARPINPNSARQQRMREAQARQRLHGPRPKPKLATDGGRLVIPPGLIEAIQTNARERRRTRADNPELNPFTVHQHHLHPKEAIPPKDVQMAMDSVLGWAGAEWGSGGPLGQVFAEGLAFPGYPYLAELAQRPEYRTFSETIATEMTRKWIKFSGKGTAHQQRQRDREMAEDFGMPDPHPDKREADEAPDTSEKQEKITQLEEFLDNLDCAGAYRLMEMNDGFFGRSHMFHEIGGNDGDTSEGRLELQSDIGIGVGHLSQSKVNPDNPLTALRGVEAVWTYPTTYNAMNPLKANWYNPEVWYTMGMPIHASRLLTQVGRPVPDLLKPAYSFGGLSMSQLAQPYVNIWLETRESIGRLIHAFSVMVLSTDMQTLMQPGGGQLMERVNLFNTIRDNNGTWVINKNTEDFKNVSAPLGGLHELQAQAQEHMASVARIPVAIFTGISPTGLNASSEGEIRIFENTIHAFQEARMRQNLTKTINFAQLSLWGEIDPDITFEFVQLRELTEKEEAELRKMDAETDDILINGCQALSPEEVRIRIAGDENGPHAGLDPDDMPEPPQPPQPPPGEGGPPGAEGEGQPGEQPAPGEPKPGGRINVSGREAYTGVGGDENPFGSTSDDGGGVGPGSPGPTGGTFASLAESDPNAALHPGHATGPGTGVNPAKKKQAHDAEWKEGDHPRAPDGKFGHGSGAAKAKDPLDVAKMTKIGEKLGSNEGGKYQDSEGRQFYIKKGKSPEHVKSEVLAAKLFRLAGGKTLKYERAGPDHIATRWEKVDKNNIGKFSEAERAQARADFATHAWLANWDAAGMENDNYSSKGGQAFPNDLGGALEWRAQGSPKGEAFGDKAGEWDTMRDPKVNAQNAALFKGMTPEELRRSALRVALVPDKDIRRAVKDMGKPPEMADKLIARKRDIERRANGDPKDPQNPVTFDLGGDLPVKELNGIPFKQWEPPADWNDVDGQIDDLDGDDEMDLDPGGTGKPKKASTGIFVVEPDGRVWLMRPTGRFGGYDQTIPKGGTEKGLTLQANAIKEVWEETGLKAKITGIAGDIEGDTSVTRYYVGEREAGDPTEHEWEASAVVLAPPHAITDYLNRSRDRTVSKYILDRYEFGEDAAPVWLALDEFNESEHPRDEGGKFAPKGSGSFGKKAKQIGQALKDALGSQVGEVKTHEDIALAKKFNKSFEAAAAGLPDDKVLGLLNPKSKAKAGSKLSIVGELLTKGATTAEVLKATGWPSISMPAQAKALGLELVKVKEGGVFKYYAKPKGEAAPEAAAKPEPAPPVEAKPPPPSAPPPKPKAPQASPGDLEKAKKTTPFYYPDGVPASAEKVVKAYNDLYEGKTLTDVDALNQKVADYKATKEVVDAAKAAEKTALESKQKAEQSAAAAKAAEEAKKEKAENAPHYEALASIASTTDYGDADEKYAKKQALSTQDVGAIKAYTGSHYGPVNAQLRKGQMSVDQWQYAQKLDRALSKLPNYTQEVYRKANLPPEIAALYQPGMVVEERAFTSTAKHAGVWHGDNHYVIKSKTGKDVQKLSHHKSESEVLFRMGTRFHVTKVDAKSGGGKVIHMEEI